MDHQATQPPAARGNRPSNFAVDPGLRGSGDPYAALEHFVLVSDLDGTLIDDRRPLMTPDPALEAFATALREAGKRLTLWFNSSRPVTSQRESLQTVPHLPTPQFQIGAMGTQVADGRTGGSVEAYGREQFGDWPRAEVHRIATERFGLQPHAPELQTRYKASYDLPDPDLAPAIEAELRDRSLPVKVVVSGGRDLDLLPPAAGKASAIKWLCGHTGTPPEAVLVSGDSANDLDMFVAPFRGIVVANAHPELQRLNSSGVFRASARCSAGVLQGLRHFGVLPEAL